MINPYFLFCSYEQISISCAKFEPEVIHIKIERILIKYDFKCQISQISNLGHFVTNVYKHLKHHFLDSLSEKFVPQFHFQIRSH